uniref:RING-type E3 ubiquitin transferase n=1 Tax=Anthurium amnicola TaxID=1678845 RepID=A0A1D1Y691_9ARAE
MKFGETFMEYLHGDQEQFLNKCSHVEYKRLKKVLKRCRVCRAVQVSCSDKDGEDSSSSSDTCEYESCRLCDQVFFDELAKEASEISGYFTSRVRRLIHLHDSPGLHGYLCRMCHCFADQPLTMIEEGKMLIDYVTFNATAMRKILKKYDKIHCSVNGRNFKTKMCAEHIEPLQSPWLIELGAFFMNFSGSNVDGCGKFSQQFSCDLRDAQPVLRLTLSDSVKLDYNLTCAICLDIVFHPYALGCGHLFCKGCACSSASVFLFEGLKAASSEAKCPICRAAGVYADSFHMVELDLLLKKRCPDYWKERKSEERTEMLKQSKEYYDLQAKFAIGYC